MQHTYSISLSRMLISPGLLSCEAVIYYRTEGEDGLPFSWAPAVGPSRIQPCASLKPMLFIYRNNEWRMC